MAYLNENLAKKQKITHKQRKNLDNLYKDLEDVFTRASNDNDIEKNGKDYAKEVLDLEFKLQENWNFNLDRSKHTWWNRLPGCLCPKMDNAERFGYDKITNSKCPYHGFGVYVHITEE
jgi:hypothetical protein